MIQTSKKLYVPAELTPATSEGVLTSADAIYDYNLNKSQLELNIYFKLSLNDYLDPLKIGQAISRLASDIKTTIKECPEAFIKNVHYQNEFDHTSKITDYVYPNQEIRRDDLPLPVLMQVFGSVLSITEEPKFTNVLEFEVQDGDIVSIYNLIPNKLYFYSTDSGIEGKFYTKDSRRFIYADNILNVRDIGGIPVSDGGHIAYNRIFRGSELRGNVVNASPTGLRYLRNLGINCEIDLRNSSESVMLGSTRIAGAEYFKESFIQFENILSLTTSNKNSIKKVFEYVVNKIHEGKVIYAHCVWGYHRCGFLMSLIEGVLGVKQCEIDKDYELSSFSPLGTVARNEGNYLKGINALKSLYNGSWVNLLLDCGVSMETIKQFRKDMIVCNYSILEQSSITEVTYKLLLQLRNSNSLIPGNKYRMIDYDTYDGAVTTYASCSGIPDLPEFKSAYHHFDLLLTAISISELDSNVKALHSARDTEGYFTNQDLSKLEIKYDLDNDKSKYSWAVNDDILVSYGDKVYYNFFLEHPLGGILRIVTIGDYFALDILLEQSPKSGKFRVIENNSKDAMYSYFAVGDEGYIDMDYSYVYVIGHQIPKYSCDWIYYVNDNKYEHIEGKGIIYYMKDEYNNEVPYDFKNIMFEYKGSWYYTFNSSASNVVIKPWIDNLGLHLNKNIFINNPIVKDCFFDFNTHENIILGNCVNFSIGKYSSNNELKNVDTCVIESDCYNIRSENSENLYIKDGCYNLNIIVSEPMFIAYNTANKTIDNNYLPDILSQEEFNVIFN